MKTSIMLLACIRTCHTIHLPQQCYLAVEAVWGKSERLWWVHFTCMIPARKVTEEATNTLCSSLVRPSKPVMLAAGPSSGTSLVTTEPIIRHKTGNGPSERERENSRFVEPGQGHKRTHSQHTAHTGLTHWDVPRGAQEKVNDDGEEGGEESVPGWQRGQQTVGQTWKHKTAHVSCRFTVWCSCFLPFTSRMKHNYLLHFSKHTVKNTKDPLFKISLKHMMFDDHFDVGWRMWKDVYT